jgi:hypothetical protein
VDGDVKGPVLMLDPRDQLSDCGAIRDVTDVRVHRGTPTDKLGRSSLKLDGVSRADGDGQSTSGEVAGNEQSKPS